MGAELEAVRLRSALGEAMKLATVVNQYLDVNAPWSAIKVDKAEAGKTVYTALKAIDSLKVMFAPFLPFTCEKLQDSSATKLRSSASNTPRRSKTHLASIRC